MKDASFFENKIEQFLYLYLNMEIDKFTIACPYWMNKIVNDKVAVRGIFNGKGTARQIQRSILMRLNHHPDRLQLQESANSLKKFARANRIGLDCSGLAYRILARLVQLNYFNCKARSLNDVFTGGIRKTNSLRLTGPKYAVVVEKWSQYRLGDLIRINGAHHVAVILSVKNELLTYVHSSWSTSVTGVHKGTIRQLDPNGNLGDQFWQEKTKLGENFGKKYFHENKGDNVYRLKIFSDNG